MRKIFSFLAKVCYKKKDKLSYIKEVGVVNVLEDGIRSRAGIHYDPMNERIDIFIFNLYTFRSNYHTVLKVKTGHLLYYCCYSYVILNPTYRELNYRLPQIDENEAKAAIINIRNLHSWTSTL